MNTVWRFAGTVVTLTVVWAPLLMNHSHSGLTATTLSSFSDRWPTYFRSCIFFCAIKHALYPARGRVVSVRRHVVASRDPSVKCEISPTGCAVSFLTVISLFVVMAAVYALRNLRHRNLAQDRCNNKTSLLLKLTQYRCDVTSLIFSHILRCLGLALTLQ